MIKRSLQEYYQLSAFGLVLKVDHSQLLSTVIASLDAVLVYTPSQEMQQIRNHFSSLLMETFFITVSACNSLGYSKEFRHVEFATFRWEQALMMTIPT